MFPLILNTAQQKGIQELVAKRGAGLLWIAGERSTPSSWRGAPLEELLPFRGSLDLPRVDRPVYMEPTDAAARIGLLRLGNTQDTEQSWPIELSSRGESWARLEWVQRIETRDLKPTTEVLANAVEQTQTKIQQVVRTKEHPWFSQCVMEQDKQPMWPPMKHGGGVTAAEKRFQNDSGFNSFDTLRARAFTTTLACHYLSTLRAPTPTNQCA